VLEAAVVAQRDADGLEKPKAYVVLAPGACGDGIAQALKAHVQDKIGKWKYPRWVEVVRQLPRNTTGKIQRFKLRETHGAESQVEERGEKLDDGRLAQG
jgi:4-hydroxybenzoate-CoA ligase